MKFYFLPMLVGLLFIIGPDIWIYLKIRNRLVNRYLRLIYWLPAVFFVLFFVGMRFFSNDLPDYKFMARITWILWLFALIYIPKVIYTIFDVVGRAMIGFCKTFGLWLSRIGAGIAVMLVVLFVYAAFIGRTRVHVKEVDLAYRDLPEQLDGFKIVQFSDLHIGNWGDYTRVMRKAVELIDDCRADMVVFTGDFVNNFSSEITPEIVDIFASMDMPRYGKYAVLGNHDYGDYSRWRTPEEKNINLNRTKSGIEECGFDLLLNNSRTIAVGDTSFLLVGVENTGKPPFRQYGNLPLAISGVDSTLFTVLLSHDASHWRQEVLGHRFIDLTLSGHTHAAQCGISWGKLHWSPSSWIYEEWEGLYRENEQLLYVNRGLGYVGIPMRIGMEPEITCFNLKRSR